VTAVQPTPLAPAARLAVTGHYAGPVSRTLAIALDAAIVMAAYTLVYAGVNLLLDAFFDTSLDLSGVVNAVVLSGWAFLYFFVSLAIAGRTIGNSVVGLRVLRADGSAVPVRAALVRTLAYPFSLLFFGAGLVPIVLAARHRAFHDRVAGTVVVYDWGGRDAQLPGPLSNFLARTGG